MNPSQSFELLVNLPLQITMLILACLLAKSLGFLWLAGFAWNLFRRGIRCLLLIQFLGDRCRPISKDEILRLPLTEQDYLPPNICWLTSADHHGPFCWQLHRPTIVLPRSTMQADPELLRHDLLSSEPHSPRRESAR